MFTIELLLVLVNAVDWRAQAAGISEMYPNCKVSDLSLIGDGICDFGDYNSEQCDYDGGDCDRFNQIVKDYPQCKARDIFRIGNGQCDTDEEYNNEDCGYDGGDCTHPEYPNCFHSYLDPKDYLNDTQCDIKLNNEACGFDGGDCDFINEKGYPFCNLYSSYPNEQRSRLGDGICDAYINNAQCGFDAGDCNAFREKYPGCENTDPARLGDGVCDAGDFISFTEECGYDEGDCAELIAILEKYPDCESTLISDYWLSVLGDGDCHSELNHEECGFDAGDCSDYNLNYPLCDASTPYSINNTECDIKYNTEECKFDGGDCDDFNAKGYINCPVYDAALVGDGRCDGGEFNTEECGWDDGDCDEYNVKYPGCQAPESSLGDGHCSQTYNTEECAYDGGDCEDDNIRFHELKIKYPNCEESLLLLHNFADGDCYWDSPAVVEECGWDGGDCTVEGYPGCIVEDPNLIGNGVCDEYEHWYEGSLWSFYNSPECGYDGGDCIAFNKYFNATYPGCKVKNPHEIGNGLCDDFWYPEYDSKECGYDGGDCPSSNCSILSSAFSSFLPSLFVFVFSKWIVG